LVVVVVVVLVVVVAVALLVLCWVLWLLKLTERGRELRSLSFDSSAAAALEKVPVPYSPGENRSHSSPCTVECSACSSP
jgi:hypothetical protein